MEKNCKVCGKGFKSTYAGVCSMECTLISGF